MNYQPQRCSVSSAPNANYRRIKGTEESSEWERQKGSREKQERVCCVRRSDDFYRLARDRVVRVGAASSFASSRLERALRSFRARVADLVARASSSSMRIFSRTYSCMRAFHYAFRDLVNMSRFVLACPHYFYRKKRTRPLFMPLFAIIIISKARKCRAFEGAHVWRGASKNSLKLWN